MRFDRFTESAQDAARRSYEIMQRFGHSQVDVEHMFLAILTQPQGEVPELLKRLTAPTEAFEIRLRDNLERTPRSPVPSTETGQGNQVFITPRLKRVIDQAVEEARQLQDEFHSTEHLLLGIVSDSKGFSGAMLSGAGIERRQILSAIKRARGTPDQRDGGTNAPVQPLVQQQRRTLATFRLSAEKRSRAEVQTDSRQREESQSTQSGLQHLLEEAKAQFAAIARSEQRGPEILATIALQDLWTNSPTTAPIKSGVGQPTQALAQAVKSSDHSLVMLSKAVGALGAERRTRSNRRTALAVTAVIGILAIVVAGFSVIAARNRASRLEALYQVAVSALEAKEWDVARSQFQQVQAEAPGYKDSAELLKEAYYRSADAARSEGDCAAALRTLRSLRQIDASYKNSSVYWADCSRQVLGSYVERRDWKALDEIVTGKSPDDLPWDLFETSSLSFVKVALEEVTFKVNEPAYWSGVRIAWESSANCAGYLFTMSNGSSSNKPFEFHYVSDGKSVEFGTGNVIVPGDSIRECDSRWAHAQSAKIRVDGGPELTFDLSN